MNNQSNLVKISKKLSYVLRHDPAAIGCEIEYDGGWLAVDELIEGLNRRNGFSITPETLDEIVRTDSKHRYSYNEDKTKLRANYGHSLAVDLGLVPEEPPEYLYHGTSDRFVESIEREGLRSMNRQRVCLSPDIETARIVGKRHGGSLVVFRVPAKAMYQDGVDFFHPVDCTWDTYSVPPQYLERIE